MTKQRGVALFFALIALLVMSLAAVALIRSVDTSTQIAGNLAFKQAATTSADSGLESAIAWVAVTAPATLNSDSAANGYYATAPTTFQHTADATWAVGSSAPASGDGFVNGYDAATGNTARYVIHRMCRVAGEPTSANCMFGAVAGGTGSKSNIDATGAGASIVSGLSPMYRVTARVTGPRNTISYIQAFVY